MGLVLRRARGACESIQLQPSAVLLHSIPHVASRSFTRDPACSQRGTRWRSSFAEEPVGANLLQIHRHGLAFASIAYLSPKSIECRQITQRITIVRCFMRHNMN